MLFSLLFPARLNKPLWFNTTNDALPNQGTVVDPESATSALSSNASTYEGEEVEVILGYIDKDTTVRAI